MSQYEVSLHFHTIRKKSENCFYYTIAQILLHFCLFQIFLALENLLLTTVLDKMIATVSGPESIWNFQYGVGPSDIKLYSTGLYKFRIQILGVD